MAETSTSGMETVFDGTGNVLRTALHFPAILFVASLLAEASQHIGLPISSMVWQAVIDPNPVLAMAQHVLLSGSTEDEGVLQLAAGIVIAIWLDLHAQDMRVCRCISACCAACLCPDEGLGKVVVIVCSFAKPAFGKRG